MVKLLKKISWDDLRILKAIGEHGGLVVAADALALNHSTLSRRLSALEADLGVVLFDRRRNGYIPTQSGAELIALSEKVECEIHTVVRKVVHQSDGHAGDLRITTSDALLLDYLTPIVADFQVKNPCVKIEVIVDNRPLNLARGDSDIALRATCEPPENLFGRRLATIAWAAYGCKAQYADRDLCLQELYTHKWVSFAGRLAELNAARLIAEQVEPHQVVYRSDSVPAVIAAVKAGIGVGLLPCMHGDLNDDLVRIARVEPGFRDGLWLLTHPDIRKSGRVCAFMTHCGEAIANLRDLIEGRCFLEPDATDIVCFQ